MFCKHFIKIFVEVPSFNGETSRMGGCEVRGAHSIFLIKNMNFFILNTLCTSRINFVVREAWQNYFFNSKALLMGELQTVDIVLREIMFLGAFFSLVRRCFV